MEREKRKFNICASIKIVQPTILKLSKCQLRPILKGVCNYLHVYISNLSTKYGTVEVAIFTSNLISLFLLMALIS